MISIGNLEVIRIRLNNYYYLTNNFQCNYNNHEKEDGGLMYILYTSGSTGKPKGVMQNQNNVLHFIHLYTKNLSITTNDRMTLFSTFTHDAVVTVVQKENVTGRPELNGDRYIAAYVVPGRTVDSSQLREYLFSE